jgi:hypothetical protein
MAVHLKDRLGRYYVADAWAEGYLLAGEWAQAEYSFQVPPGVAGLELVVDIVDPVKKWPTLSRTFIGLGDQPVLSDSALSHMLGSLAPNALPLGKPGQVDSFELAVQKVDFPNTSACSDIKPGERPVLVTVSVLNDTSADAESYALQAFIKDHQGFYYASCNRKDDRQAYGPLSPGASLSAQYSFLIPDLPGDLFLAQSKIGETDKKVFFLLK